MSDKNSSDKISSAVIARLPRYYRYLGELLEEGIDRISSKELSERMKVTASQIRQDLNNFGGFGQQGYGYNVQKLYDEIGKILGIGLTHNMIVIGAGHLGQAIANYANYGKRGFVIKALFDINPDLAGYSVNNAPVLPLSKLEDYLAENDVKIAAICIPKTHAGDVAKRLAQGGVKAIWNFSHLDLEVPDDVIVENVHLSESLMKLSYRLNYVGRE